MTERKMKRSLTMTGIGGRVGVQLTTMPTVAVAVVESLARSFAVLQGQIRPCPNPLHHPRPQSPPPRAREGATVAKEGRLQGFGVAGGKSIQTLQSKSCTP